MRLCNLGWAWVSNLKEADAVNLQEHSIILSIDLWILLQVCLFVLSIFICTSNNAGQLQSTIIDIKRTSFHDLDSALPTLSQCQGAACFFPRRHST